MVKHAVITAFVLLFCVSFAYGGENDFYDCKPSTFDPGNTVDTAWVTGEYRIEHLRIVGYYAIFAVLGDDPIAPSGNDAYMYPYLAYDISGDYGSQKYALLLAAVANDQNVSFHLTQNHATDPTYLTPWNHVCEVDNVNIHGKPKGSL